MKKFQLQIPTEPKCVYFDLLEDGTVNLFTDAVQTKPVPLSGKTVCIDLRIPDDLLAIQVFNPTSPSLTPIERIYESLKFDTIQNSNLKSFSVIFNDSIIEITVEDEKVNPDLFLEKCQQYSHLKDWALAIFEIDDFKSGELYWNF